MSDGNGGCVCVAGYTLVGGTCVQQVAPKLTLLAVAPPELTPGLSKIVPLVPGTTSYTFTTIAGARHKVGADPDKGRITYKQNGVAFDPNTVVLSAPTVVTMEISADDGTSATYTLTLATEAAPTLTGLAVAPDPLPSFSDIKIVPLVAGTTSYTFTTTAGARHKVAAEADKGTITYKQNGVAFDHNTVVLTAPATITIEIAATDGTSATYTLTLSAPPALTNAAVTMSSTVASATNVTYTITFTTPVEIPAGGRITVSMPGFTLPATPSASFTAPAGTPPVRDTSFAANVLTVQLALAVAPMPAGPVTLRVFGGTNPAAQAARTDVAMSGTDSAGTVLARTTTGTMTAIIAPPALTNATVTMSSTTAGATSVTATVTFTTPVAISSGGKINVAMPGFAFASPVATFTKVANADPNTFSNTATFANGALTLTIPFGESAGVYTFSVTGGTNPAAQAARTDVAFSVTSAAGTVLASTSTGTMSAIIAAAPTVTNVSITSSSTVPGAGAVTFTATFTTATVIPAGGVITVTFPHSQTATFKAAFRSGHGTATLSFSSSNSRTLEFNTATAAISPGTVTLTIIGLPNPSTTIQKERLTVATLDASRAPIDAAGVATADLVVTQRVATKLGFVNPPTKVASGEKFTLQVAAQDETSNTVTSATAVVDVAAAPAGITATQSSATTVGGLASVTGLSFRAPGTYLVSASARGLSTATTQIVVAADTTPAYIAFSTVPTHEVTNFAFGAQPVVKAYNRAGLVVPDTGTVTLTLAPAPATGSIAVLSGLAAGPVTGTLAAGTASFSSVKATGASGEYLLTATYTLLGATTELFVSTRFTLHSDATAASTARSSASQSVSFNIKLSLDSSILDNATQKAQYAASLRNDLCLAAGLTTTNCNLQVTIAKALTIEGVPTVGGLVPAQAVVTGGTTEMRELNPNLIEERLGATPRGTGIVATYAAIGRDQDGQLLEAPPSGRLALTLIVGAADVPAGTPAGDLKVAVWDGDAKRWTYVPAHATRADDGTYRVVAAGRYGIYAVVYVPGAGLISGFSGFSGAGTSVGLGVFAGGSADLLRQVAELHEANAVWAQDPLNGELRLFVIGGPAFVNAAFLEAFSYGVDREAVVLLVQTPRS